MYWGGVYYYPPCRLYRVRVLYCPPPSNSKKKFSDGSRRFEFEWAISGQGLKIGLALKSRFTRENLRISKSFQTGQGCLSSRGGGDNKVHEHGKFQNTQSLNLQLLEFQVFETLNQILAKNDLEPNLRTGPYR